MKVEFRSYARRAINTPLGLFGFELVRRQREHTEYIPFKETIAGANKAGLSVGDYIDATYNVSGATQETIKRMADLGVFSRKIERVCEIGPGSGRYLEKTMQVCSPAHYEIYETSREWREWLVEKYGVTAQPTDGFSLSPTPSRSIDLIQAHKVFAVCEIGVVCNYLIEMERVVRDNGMVVFDLVTERSMDDATLAKWLASGPSWLVGMFPKRFVTHFFETHGGLSYVGGFLVPMAPVITEYFVFARNRPN